MKAKDIMMTDVPVIHLHTPVMEAVRKLKMHCDDKSYLNAAPGMVVVNDNGELAGIMSPLTIIKALLDSSSEREIPATPDKAFYKDLCETIKDLQVQDIMDWQPISVTEEASLLDVADLFVKNRFQRVPVVKDKKVIGIIYRSKLMFAMANCLTDDPL